jgi:hypothetical protein
VERSPVCDKKLFGGSSVLCELNETIVDSGVEPTAFYQSWLTHSGINPRSSLAVEVGVHLHTLFLLYVIDRLDGGALRLAEHLARRVTMIMKAVKRNPKSPDFGGLDLYTEHIPDPTVGLKVGEFDKHVVARQTVTAQILKQGRLTREEEDAEDKRNRAPTGGDGGGGGTDDRNKKKKKEKG